MGANWGIRRSTRRLVLAAVVGCAVSMLFSAPALAQTVGVTQTTAPVVQQAAAPLTQAAAPVVQTAAPVGPTVAPVLQTGTTVVSTVAPVVQTAAPVVQQAAAPVVQTAAPVVQYAAGPALGAAAPLLRPAGQVTDSVGDPVRKVSPALNAAHGSLDPAATVAGSTEATVAGEEATAAGGSNDEVVVPTAALGERDAVTGRARSARDIGHRPPRVLSISTIPRVPVHAEGSSSDPTSAAGSRTTAVSPRRSAPEVPSGPFFGLFAAMAAALASGASLILVAALAAALVLAAPGLGRRLRLTLAPWPLPTALPSLERPG